MIVYRYYTLQRPPAPGAIPPGAVNVGEFYQKSMVDKINRKAWGFADYPKRLDVQTVHQYELRFGGEIEQ